jgi:hypothetical protein
MNPSRQIPFRPGGRLAEPEQQSMGTWGWHCSIFASERFVRLNGRKTSKTSRKSEDFLSFRAVFENLIKRFQFLLSRQEKVSKVFEVFRPFSRMKDSSRSVNPRFPWTKQVELVVLQPLMFFSFARSDFALRQTHPSTSPSTTQERPLFSRYDINDIGKQWR